MHHRASLSFSILALVTILGTACSNDYTPGSGSAPPPKPAEKPPREHTIVVPYGIPLKSKIVFDKKPVGDVVASPDQKFHIAKITLPDEVEPWRVDGLEAQVPSPCGEAMLPLENPPKSDKPPAHDPAWTSFRVKDGHWDKARVYVHRGPNSKQTIKVGKVTLAADVPEGQPHEMFGFTCPEARKVFFDDKEVGQLPPPEKKDEGKSYLVTTEKAQTYCMSQASYGAVGLASDKSEKYAGANVYTLMSSVDYWMKDPPDKITTDASPFQNELKYALKTGACAR